MYMHRHLLAYQPARAILSVVTNTAGNHTGGNGADVPLIANRARVESTAAEAVEIIYYGPEGFEKKNAFFWAMFDATIGWMFGRYIRRKSLGTVSEKLSVQGNTPAELLECAQNDLTKKYVPELFDLRTRFFNEKSPLMQHFCQNVANGSAIDDVYNANGDFCFNGQPIYPLSAVPDGWSKFYLNCPNGQSVRNRYRQVVRLYERSGGGSTLSIACGSAQALIQGVHNLKAKGRKRNCKLLLTDVSKDSLSFAERRAKEAGISDQVVTKRSSIRRLAERFGNEHFDVVEACGIFDYLDDKAVVKIIRFALGALNPKGIVIASNMSETRGAKLLLNTYNWPIHYRTPKHFGELVSQAGGCDVKVYVEPWGIHPVATATV